MPGRIRAAASAVANAPAQHRQQPLVELPERRFDRLARRADEVRRDALHAALELSLVKEAQARRQEGDDGGGFVAAGREGCRRPRLVVVLQEPGEPVLIVEAGVEVLAHRPRVPLAEPVVQPLVVGVVEALLQHRPFEVPVDLGHEAEARDAARGPAPSHRARTAGRDAPGALEDVRQDEHGHVAAHAVALPGDPEQLAEHRLLRGRVAVVELQRVGPAGEVRVAPVAPAPDRRRGRVTRV